MEGDRSLKQDVARKLGCDSLCACPLQSLTQKELQERFNWHANGGMQAGEYAMLAARPGAEIYGFGLSAIKRVSFQRSLDNASPMVCLFLQSLTQNELREKVILRADGGMRSGKDVMLAAALGADEYGFGTVAMIATGCIMARVCHTNNCPVGVASQREELRARFPGAPADLVRNEPH